MLKRFKLQAETQSNIHNPSNGFLSKREKIMSDSSPEKLTGQIRSQILTELKVRGDFEHLPLPLLFCSWFSPARLMITILCVGRRQEKGAWGNSVQGAGSPSSMQIT